MSDFSRRDFKTWLPAKRAVVTAALLAAVAVAVLWPGAGRDERKGAEPDAAAVAGPDEGPFGGPLSPFQFAPQPFPAPGLGFTTGAGTPVTLSDFAGRVVLLNFWATWCAPCLGELPALDRLQTRLRDEPFVVIALNEDRQAGLETIESVYRDIRIEALPLYLDPEGKVAKALQVTGLPTTVLIDGAGRVVGGLSGPAEWDTPAGVALIRRVIASQP
jgi:thiol-disulfide isomerase/thioredoxin